MKRIIAGIVIALAITGCSAAASKPKASTTTVAPTPTTEAPAPPTTEVASEWPNGWTDELALQARAAFVEGSNGVFTDDQTNCMVGWVIDNYTPADLAEASVDELTTGALAACNLS